MSTPIAVIRCNTYESSPVLEAVRKSVDLIGGISSFIKPASKVLLKPNLLMAKEPDSGVDTHPEVIRAVVRLLKEINCRLYLGDGPSVWGNQIENVDEVYRLSGVKAVCEEEGIELVKFDRRRWRKNFPLTRWLDECDFVVNIAKFKTHDFTLMTGAIKNLFGLVPGTYKTELHKNYFHPKDFSAILVDIYEEARPALTVVDGIVAMEGDGPATAGKLRNLGLVLAGSDCVALDTVMALVMGVRPDEILSTREAAKRGLGVSDIKEINILGEKLEDIIAEPFLLPSTTIKKNIPRPIMELARKLIKYYPCVDHEKCIRCSACVQACPGKAITLKNDRIMFNYAKCISCFCCQEACPNAAIKVKKSILAKMIGL